MEQAFGTGFGQVRVHDNPTAAALSTSISASAFTTGNDIFFGRGQFSPETAAGERVLAHELAHTLQQSPNIGRWNPFRRDKKDKPVTPAVDGSRLIIPSGTSPTESVTPPTTRARSGAVIGARDGQTPAPSTPAPRGAPSSGTQVTASPAPVTDDSATALQTRDGTAIAPTTASTPLETALQTRDGTAIAPTTASASTGSPASENDTATGTTGGTSAWTPASPSALKAPARPTTPAPIDDADLDAIQRVVADCRKAKDPREKLLLVDAILGLSENYLERHGASPERARGVAKVEDYYAFARRDHGQALAQAQYLADAYKTSGPSQNGQNTQLTQLKQKNEATVIGGAKTLGAGNTDVTMNGATDATLELVKTYGLTEAEILAIKVYTNADYLYINPATANVRGWLEGQNLTEDERNPKPADPTDPIAVEAAAAAAEAKKNKVKSLVEEGTLHAGVAMMGLQKLPAMSGPTYRGARMTEAEFQKKYEGQTSITFDAFTSSATQRHAAQDFANGGGDQAPRADQTTSVMATFVVNNARDIRDLSIYGAGEEEWLLLPGATFAIGKITPMTTGPAGTPPAKKWYEVMLTQTK